MRISHRNISTKEEKVAIKMANLLNDFTLDLDKVGYYLYYANPYLLYRRTMEVMLHADFLTDIDEQQKIGYKEDDRIRY